MAAVRGGALIEDEEVLLEYRLAVGNLLRLDRTLPAAHHNAWGTTETRDHKATFDGRARVSLAALRIRVCVARL